MREIEQIPQLSAPAEKRWQDYLIDSLLAVGGVAVLTVIIYAYHLYPTIPNISLIYLLLIMLLASTRGRYAAIVTAVISALAFDYFLVPPFFTFVIARSRGMDCLVCLPGDGFDHQPAHDADAAKRRAGQITRA